MTGVFSMVVQWFQILHPIHRAQVQPCWGTKILYAAALPKKEKENTGKLYYLTKNNRKE